MFKYFVAYRMIKTHRRGTEVGTGNKGVELTGRMDMETIREIELSIAEELKKEQGGDWSVVLLNFVPLKR